MRFTLQVLKAFQKNQGLLLAGALAYYILLSVIRCSPFRHTRRHERQWPDRVGENRAHHPRAHHPMVPFGKVMFGTILRYDYEVA
jgi:hypothetical protein